MLFAPPTDYKSAGVDTRKAASFISALAPLIRSTSRVGADVEIGGFGGLFDLKACGFDDPLLVAASDGVGTKLKLAFASGIHHTVGIDLVAMCVNDLLVQGAEPLFFLDYMAHGSLPEQATYDALVGGIVAGCTEAGCALLGGETAEMPGMYPPGEYDLAGFSVGAVERDKLIRPENLREGHVLLGLPSSGFHSNGFSLIRKVIADISLDDPAPFTLAPETGKLSLAEALLTPTKIYTADLLPHTDDIIALWHITGGGFPENLARGVPESLAVRIDTPWSIPDCFVWLAEQGRIAPADMFATFNMGIGMVAAVADEHAEAMAERLSAWVIGRIVTRQQVAVEINPACMNIT